MPAIFISHSSRDQAIADEITQALKRTGFEEVFLDFDKDTGIGAGADWEKTLYDKLTRCHALVLILTPNWLASTWCRIELAQARALGKVILPIVCAPVGEKFVLPEIQSVDVIDWKSDGIARIEKRLQAITSELARGFSFDASRSPYPGIHAFEQEDAAIYFGRDEETRAIIERLDARRSQGGSRLIVIIGASGSGKSSLLKAGVLPQLARRKRDWVVLPPLRPEKAPVEVLAKAIAEKLEKPHDWRTWETKLSGADAVDHIAELLKDFRVGESRAATVLLPIDQFEEAFTVATPAQRTALLQLIATALDPARDLPLMVLATARSDVLEGLIETGVLAQLLETYPLAPMPLERVPRLVEGPAAVASINIDKGLAERIARDVETSEALPLLAHALWLLYRRGSDDKRLSHVEYESLGDREHGLNPIQNSVRLVADQALAGMKPSERELAALRDAFIPHLVRTQLSDGKRVRQPARMSELPADSMRLVRALIEARLLTTRQGGADTSAETGAADTVVEVSHEALFQAWPTLEQWLNEEQSFLSDLERVRHAQEVWAQAPDSQRADALLQGLLLSRAREWLVRYPQRFVGRDMEATHGFIAASVAADDERRAAAEAQRAKSRRMERMLFRGAVAAAILFAVAGAVVTYQYFSAESARREAVRERERAETQRNRALLSESRFLANDALQTLPIDPTNAMLIALSALPDSSGGTDRPYAREAEAALRSSVQARRERLILKGHDGKLLDVAFSPDGKRVATTSEDRTARLWDATTGHELAVLGGHGDAVGRLAFSADGSRLVTSSNDDTHLWDAVSGRRIAVVPGHIGLFSVDVFAPDGKVFVTVNHKDNTARVWSAADGTRVASVAGHAGPVIGAAFSPDGKHLATTSMDRTARIWDVGTWREAAVLRGHQGQTWGVHFSPDGRRIVTASYDGTARIWDVAAGRELTVLRLEPDPSLPVQRFIWSATFNAKGTRILTKSIDGLQLWDAETGLQVPAFPKSGTTFWVGAFSPDGGRIVTAAKDKRARIWSADTGQELAVLSGHNDGLVQARFSPDGSRVVSASDDLTARLWDVQSSSEFSAFKGVNELWTVDVDAQGTRIATVSMPESKSNVVQVWEAASGRQVLKLDDDLVASVQFSPDGKLLAIGSADRSAKLLEIESGRRLAALGGHAATVFGVSFNRDGSRLLSWSDDGTARLWNVATHQLVAPIAVAGRRLSDMRFSPGGRRVLALSHDAATKERKDGKVHIWDAVTGAQVAALGEPSANMQGASYSDDDRLIATADGAVARIWDGSNGNHIRNLEGHTGAIRVVRFSPDASLLATVSADSTVRVWDIASGRTLFTFKGRLDFISAAFSSDGTRLLTGTLVGSLSIWDLRSGQALATFDPKDSYVPAANFVAGRARVLTTLRESAYLIESDTGFLLAEIKSNAMSGRWWQATDGSALLVVKASTGHGWLRIPTTTQSLVDYAKAAVPRCLTREQRAALLLDPAPPDWCIELEKWPYHTPAWKQWLADRRGGLQPRRPDK